jgi:hypothetical protein
MGTKLGSSTTRQTHLRFPSDQTEREQPLLSRQPAPSELGVGLPRQAPFAKDDLLHFGIRGQIHEQEIKEGREDDALVCVAYEKQGRGVILKVYSQRSAASRCVCPDPEEVRRKADGGVDGNHKQQADDIFVQSRSGEWARRSILQQYDQKKTYSAALLSKDGVKHWTDRQDRQNGGGRRT